MEVVMSTPTPERPTMDDDLDLDRAYAQAHALAAGEHRPAPAVRANVLAAAREIAAQAAARADVAPPLTPVAPPVADVGRGRAGAWNLSSWRVRSGAAFCAVLLVGLAAVRFDASRKAGDNVTVAAADQALSVQVMPAPAPAELAPPPQMMAPAPEPTLVMPLPPVDAAAPAPRERAEDATLDKPASRDPERAVAKSDQPARAIDQARVADARAAPREPAAAFAAAAPDPRADAARNIASLAPPTLAYAPATPVAAALAKAAPGSTTGASLRSTPTPLLVAANADDVDALGKLLADPATRVDAPDAQGRTALQVAVAAANVRAVRLLLAAGADPDHADASGATPRSVARTRPNAEIAALLVAR
jgi:hypothetical protein